MNVISFKSIILFMMAFILSACGNATKIQEQEIQQPIQEKVVIKQEVRAYDNLDALIIDMANQLQQNSKLDKGLLNELAITAFVDLHQLNKSTKLGRVLGESMYNELFVRGFDVYEFRGQKAINVNATGEFFITRDINKLPKEVKNSYVLVGTYSAFGNGILVNARVVDNVDGKVLSSARGIYNILPTCELFENCKPKALNPVQKKLEPKLVTKTIKLTTDNCSKEVCP
ncbi:MAG: FlgO family outer membrane protein [Arcobacteraceae bacterium]